MEGLTGFEPVLKVLQTHALPLGYSPNKLTKQLYHYNYIITRKKYEKNSKKTPSFDEVNHFYKPIILSRPKTSRKTKSIYYHSPLSQP